MTFAEYREREALHEYKQAFELQKIRLLLMQNAKEGATLKDIFSIPLFDCQTEEAKNNFDLSTYVPLDLFELFPDLKED